MKLPLRWEELPSRVENAIGRVDCMPGSAGGGFHHGGAADVNEKRWSKNCNKVADKCYIPARLAFLPARYDLLVEEEERSRLEEKKRRKKERSKKCIKKLQQAAQVGLSSLMAGLQTVHIPPIPSATSLVFNFNSPKASH